MEAISPSEFAEGMAPIGITEWPRITRTDFKRTTMRRSAVRKSRAASLKGDIHAATRNGSIATSNSVPPPNTEGAAKKPAKEITVRPGLRAMLYGLTMKMEREEANLRKLQKKMHEFGYDCRALLQPPEHESRSALRNVQRAKMQRSTSSGTPTLASLAQNVRRSILQVGQRSFNDDRHSSVSNYGIPDVPPKSVSFHDLVESRSVLQFALRSLSPNRHSANASSETLYDSNGSRLSFRKSISSFILSTGFVPVPGAGHRPSEVDLRSSWWRCCCPKRRNRKEYYYDESDEYQPQPSASLLPESVHLQELSSPNHLTVPSTSQRHLIHQQSSSYASSSVLNAIPSTASNDSSRLSLHDIPSKFRRFRQKSASDFSLVFDIIRSGSAVDTTGHSPVPRHNRASASTGNLSKRKSLRREKKKHFEHMRPNYIHKQLQLVQEEKAMQSAPSAPIDATKFVAYVTERRKKRILFKGEYLMILRSIDPAKCSTEIGARMGDRNQYSDTLPYDNTRVVLSTIDGELDSHYINASYVHSWLREKAYIVTQSVKTKNASNDFWRMVWEQRSNAIVMLTKVFDFMRVMCVKYWPLEKFQFRHIEVEMLETKTYAHFVIRTFRLRNLEDSDASNTRIVKHFHFTEWELNSFPYVSAFIELRRRVRQWVDANPADAPLIVHCR